jgi:hypothetical protein
MKPMFAAHLREHARLALEAGDSLRVAHERLEEILIASCFSSSRAR